MSGNGDALVYPTVSNLLAAGVKAVLFDFDATLVESDDAWHEVDKRFFRNHGLILPDDFQAKLSVMGFEEGARYVIDTFGVREEPLAICEEWFSLASDYYRTNVTYYEGAREYLAALRESGIRTAITTANNPGIISSMPAGLNPYGMVDTIVCGCEVARGSKKYPDIFMEATRRLGAAPGACAVFDDLPQALLTARGLGMRVYGRLTGIARQPVDELLAHSDAVFDDWRALLP